MLKILTIGLLLAMVTPGRAAASKKQTSFWYVNMDHSGSPKGYAPNNDMRPPTVSSTLSTLATAMRSRCHQRCA